MNHAALILFRALRNPNAPAFATPRGVATYGELAAATLGCVQRLDQLGLKSPAVIGIGVRDLRAHLALILAAELRGLASVSIQSSFALATSGLRPAALFLDEPLTEPDPPPVHVVDHDWLSAPPNLDPNAVLRAAPFAPDRVVRIVLSSGTTGAPKPIALTAGVNERRLAQTTLLFGAVPEDGRSMTRMGLSTMGGYLIALQVLVSGGMLGFANNGPETLALLRAFGFFHALLSPAHVQELIEANGAGGPLPALRQISVGGSRVQGALMRAAALSLTENITILYGSTEACGVSIGRAAALGYEDGACGYVGPWAQLEIVDEDGRALAAGSEGVIRTRSNTMGHYVGAHVETDADALIRDGWFYPGDIGVLRNNGALIVTGRAVELINAGGAKVAPELLEQVLLEHGAVRDSAVFGAPDRFGTERIWAAVVRLAPIDEATLQDHCRARLPSGSPNHIVWVDEIPRGDTGKILRERVREDILARFS